MIFSIESIILIIFALIWILVAIIQDFESREVADWWNFSLIFLILGYRIFLSIFSWNYWWILWGLIGLVVGFGIANLFYYSRLFAGGDAKLLIALGTILPLTLSFDLNLKVLIVFLIGFMILGGFYGLIYSFILSLIYFKDFKKEFKKEFKKNKLILISLILISLICFLVYIFSLNYLFGFLSVLFFITGFLFLFAKSVEECCLVKEVDISKVTVGDWIVNDIYINSGKTKKIIYSNWDGLTKKDIKCLKENNIKKVLIRYGIPFTPSFLFGFISVLFYDYLLYFFLRNSSF